MRWFIWTCLLVIFICGCTRHHRLGEMGPEETTYFEKRSAQAIFTVYLRDGRISRGTGLTVENGEYVWTDDTIQDSLSVETELAEPGSIPISLLEGR